MSSHLSSLNAGSYYWLAKTSLIVCIGLITIDSRRLRQLAPAGLAGMMLSGAPLLLDREAMPLMLTDNGPIWNPFSIVLLQQTAAAPAVAMWFAQGGSRSGRVCWKRLVLFTLFSLSMEALEASAGRVVHASNWHPALSIGHYLLFFAGVWAVQRWIGAPRWFLRGHKKAPPS